MELPLYARWVLVAVFFGAWYLLSGWITHHSVGAIFVFLFFSGFFLWIILDGLVTGKITAPKGFVEYNRKTSPIGYWLGIVQWTAIFVFALYWLLVGF